MFDGDFPFTGTIYGAELSECHLAWLTHLCRCVPHAESAGLILCVEGKLEKHWFPEPFIADEAIKAVLTDLSEQPVQFANLTENDRQRALIICALPTNHLAHIPSVAMTPYTQGAVTMLLPQLDETQLTALSRLICQNFDWHTLLIDYALKATRANPASVSTDNSSANVTSLLEHADAFECAQAATKLLASAVNCERVTACRLDAAKSSILSISGLKNPDRRQDCNVASVRLFAALDPIENGLVSPLLSPETKPAFDKHLSSTGADACVAFMHESQSGQRIGLLFESDAGEPLEARVQQNLESNILPTLEVLGLKFAAEMSPLTNAQQIIRSRLGNLFGARHLRTKLLAVVVVTLCALAFFAPMDFRITAPVELVGATQRAVAAPYDGYVSAAHVEAGMTVKKDQVLVELDTSKLALELEKWQSEKSKLGREYDRALSELDQAEAQIFRAQIGQAEAELNLVQSRIAQSRITAPFNGVVITGDLRRSIGAPVDQGEVLFEIAPLNDYQVVLSVDERDIYHVAAEQTGTLVLNALPSHQWQFETSAVASAVPTEDGNREFRVEAKLNDPSEQLRPGMEGLGKISVGRESTAYILTRRFLAWMQLNLWAKLP